MKKFISIFLIFVLFIFINNSLSAQVKLTTSNLPIVLIDTQAKAILEDNKILSTIKVIDNQSQNNITDTPTYESNIGIEYRGSTSFQLAEKKPYNVELRDIDGITQKNDAFLKMPSASDWAFLAPYTDKTMIREAFLYSTAQKMMPWAPHFKFVELVLNGNYQGVYMVCEKIQRSKNRVNIDKMNDIDVTGDELTGGYIFSLDKFKPADNYFLSKYLYPGGLRKPEYVINYPRPANIKPAQQQYIKNWVYNFEDIMASKNFVDTTNGYQKYLDIPQFVDFVLLNELSRNVDGYRLSTYFAKDKDSKNPKLQIASVWDYNIAFGNANYCRGDSYEGWAFDFNDYCKDDYWVISQWMTTLIHEPKFQNQLKIRWQALRKSTLADDKITANLDSIKQQIGDNAINRNFKKYNILNTIVWPNPIARNTYDAEYQYLNIWTLQRCKWLDNEFSQITPLNPLPDSFEAVLFPNPVSEALQIKYAVYIKDSKVSMNVLNMLGQNVFSASEEKIKRGFNVSNFDVSQLAKGTYIYNFIVNEKVFSGKFVKI